MLTAVEVALAERLVELAGIEARMAALGGRPARAAPAERSRAEAAL